MITGAALGRLRVIDARGVWGVVMKKSIAVVLMVVSAMCGVARAQEKGVPGKFDFYLMNLAWSPEFCSIQGVSPQCKARDGFILHGLWAENNDGSYPVFCAERAGPAHPEKNLDLTPDLMLLQHEWDKHGTCTTLSPEAFFAAERKAYHSLKVPDVFMHIDHEVQMKPAEILDLFGKINPGFPAGSILLSCTANRLTAVEACVDKGLKPMVCLGLKTCGADMVKVVPPAH
jgi:ribonuclease T2